MNTQNNSVSKHAVSFGLSLSVCSLINSLLVIAKEKSAAVQSAMQRLTGHHWITHSAIVLVLFAILGFLFGRVTISTNRLIQTILAAVILSTLLIVGFYLTAD